MKLVRYMRDYRRFKRMGKETDVRFALPIGGLHPCLSDATSEESFDRYYLYHTAWAAMILAYLRPPFHINIGSDLRFVTLVSAFIPVRHYDYRLPSLRLESMTSQFADILALPFQSRSAQSVFCMHVAEHIGMGRYEGDIVERPPVEQANAQQYGCGCFWFQIAAEHEGISDG